MLVEFRVHNHRSLRDEQALSLEATYRAAEGDVRARLLPSHTEPLLSAAALYGANASGKSNVIDALAFMQDAVLYSHRAWEPEGGVPREPFAWDIQTSAPSTFEVIFISDGTRYHYGFVVDDHRFIEEWLYAWPKRRQQTWFERDADRFKYGDHLKGENRLVEQVTRPNALFLSAAVQHRHEQLGPVYRWFKTLTLHNTARQRRRWMSQPFENWLADVLGSAGRAQQSLFAAEPATDERAAFLKLLRAADVGIVDLRVLDDSEDRGRPSLGPTRVLVRHQHSSVEAWLPLDQESHGTQTLLRLAPAFLGALRNGSVLAIDELERGLHPLLAAYLVSQFHDPATNPRNAQIIFTTHDTDFIGTTLGESLLRRDQVWLTEKDEDGASSLVPLADYKPRKAENLERGYLQGRYGAIPILDRRGFSTE